MFYILFLVLTFVFLVLAVFGLVCYWKIGYLITALSSLMLIMIATIIANDPNLVIDTAYADGIWYNQTVTVPFYPYTPILLALLGGLFLLISAYSLKRE